MKRHYYQALSTCQEHPLTPLTKCRVWREAFWSLRPATKQLETFFSWTADPQAAGWDALQQDWTALNGFANPPFALISRVLAKAAQEKATITLVAPFWQSRPWFPTLMEMICDWPLTIDGEATWVQADGNQNEWRLVAWRISGDTSKSEVFRRRRAAWWAELRLEPPRTILIGEIGSLGAIATGFHPGEYQK